VLTNVHKQDLIVMLANCDMEILFLCWFFGPGFTDRARP